MPNLNSVTLSVLKLLYVSGLQITLYTPDLSRNWPISQSSRSFLYCLFI